MAIIQFKSPLPNIAATEMVNTMDGNACTASTKRMTTVSKAPPIYPQRQPIAVPITKVIATTAQAAKMDLDAPFTRRQKIHLPI